MRSRLPIGPVVQSRLPKVNCGTLLLRVLLVDDEPCILDSYSRLLTAEGFHIDTATDGSRALALVRAERYEVVVLDERLPDIAGIEVLAQLRREGIWTPVLMFTGFPDTNLALRAGQLQAAGYLQKALTTAPQLAVAIRGVASRHSSPPQPAPPLFSVYNGRQSDAFQRLTAVLSDESDVCTGNLPRLLAHSICAPDLTFVEFVAAAKSLHLLLTKGHLPWPVLVGQVQGW